MDQQQQINVRRFGALTSTSTPVQRAKFPSQNRTPFSEATSESLFVNKPEEESRPARRRELEIIMNQNLSSFVIGIIGAVITLSAYSQTLMSPTQCIGVGLVVLIFGLLVREGLINL
nr:hypothetical protein CK203_037271 [Ipomoea trifida]